jgi:hypothetical protein
MNSNNIYYLFCMLIGSDFGFYTGSHTSSIFCIYVVYDYESVLQKDTESKGMVQLATVYLSIHR